MPINFSEIRENADKQSVSLQEIAIIYEGLTEAQITELLECGLLANDLGSGKCIGRFAKDGNVLFPEMATGVFTLSA